MNTLGPGKALRPLVLVTVAAVLLAFVSGSDAGGGVRETKILPSDGSEGAQFGRAIAMDGDLIVVGAWHDGHAGPSSGAAYVFRWDGSEWVEEAKLVASDAEALDRFGFSVAISGDTIVVGSRYDNHAFFSAGSAYVFRYNGAEWVQEAKLTAADAQPQDQFGVRVSISGDAVVVGAPFRDDFGTDSGAAYVFRRIDGSWTREAKLTVPELQPNDHFGGGAYIDGDTIVISALHHDVTDFNEGAAWVFERQDGEWVQTAKLVASDGEADDRFGIRVTIEGHIIVIGSWLDDDLATDAGSVYVFRNVDGEWVEEAKLYSIHPGLDDHFGVRVSISGDRIAVGAADDNIHGQNIGSAYVFRWDGTAWLPEAKIGATDGAHQDHFGGDVSVSGDILAVGSRGDDDQGTDSGSAYVYRLNVMPDCSSPTIVGTDGPDLIFGTPGDDVIDARGGNDYIAALNGNDIICAGDGADTIFCGRGLDVVHTGPGVERKVEADCETVLDLP